MLNRIFGIETEYGLLVNQDQPEHSPGWFAHAIRDHIFYQQKKGLIDLHHRAHDEPPGNGGFLANAGRIYLDMGHLEFASPECHSLLDLVASDRAGDQLIQQALLDLGYGSQLSLIKNNIDHETDATFGCHENYLVTRRFPFTRRGLEKLIPFLVTRQIFTGSGRIGSAAPQDEWVQRGTLIIPRSNLRSSYHQDRIPYQISQRADFIVNDFFEWVQGNRAIVNTRDEPLADPNEFRRIHLLLGDSNMAEVATALKFGTTALVLQLIEEGHVPTGLELVEPVEDLQDISRDQERAWIITLRSGKSMSAIDIQEEFLEAASRQFQGQDDETDWILREWASVLEDLRGDYRKLVGRVDWASKLWLLETFQEAEGLEWDDPYLKSLDIEYHNLNRESGLYFGLVEEGRVSRVTTDQAIRLAEDRPPRNTRAFGRGELIAHLLKDKWEGPDVLDERERASPDYIINWSIFKLRGQLPFLMSNPFHTYVQEIHEHVHVS